MWNFLYFNLKKLLNMSSVNQATIIFVITDQRNKVSRFTLVMTFDENLFTDKINFLKKKMPTAHT